jgi:hypothetical protein
MEIGYMSVMQMPGNGFGVSRPTSDDGFITKQHGFLPAQERRVMWLG